MAISHVNGIAVSTLSHINGVSKTTVSEINGISAGFSVPAPNTITPVFCCGIECGQLGSAGHPHWDSLSGSVSISTSTVRSGARSLRFNPSAASVQINCTQAQATIQVYRFYVRFATLPNINSYITYSGIDRMGLVFKQSDSKLYCASGTSPATATLGASGFTVTTGQWYRIDIALDHTSGAKTVNAKVDGTTIGGLATALTGGTSQIRLGSGAVSVTGDWFIDDFLLSHTLADYPLGAGYVNHFVPTSDGSHNTGTAGNFKEGAAGSNITDVTTTSFGLVDEVPLDDTTPDTNDYINAAADTGAGSNYVEHVIGPASGISTPGTGPRAVEVVVAYHQAGTGTGNSTFKLNDNGTEDTIVALNAAGVTTIRYSRKHYVNAPSDSNAWRASGANGNFNNLRHRFGYSTDGNPDQYFDCVMVEAEFV